jgi:hypothetical protein
MNNVILSYGLLAAALAAGYYYYQSVDGRKKRAAAIKKAGALRSDKKGKKKYEFEEKALSGTDAAASSTGGVSKAKAKKVKAPKGKQSTENNIVPSFSEVAAQEPTKPVKEKDSDDKDFAAAMSGIKAGVKGAKGTQSPKKPNRAKTNRSTLAVPDADNDLGSSSAHSAPSGGSVTSSTTGADGDDDLSPVGSPEIGATTGSSKDVADMLETREGGPSVLRLTGDTQSRPAKKSQQLFQTQETKKQRQNREKNEQKRLLREEDEKNRRVLEEKQRRTARIAEGRPAKNGENRPAAAPSNSAWAKSNGATHRVQTPHVVAPSEGLFLDDTNSNIQPVLKGVSNGVSNGASTHEWEKGLPAEEEQLRQIRENSDDNWSEVKSKKNKKKVNGNLTGNESSGASVVG